MNQLRYNSYAEYFKHTFGRRMQKLSVDAGFSCPNRDPNDRSKGGCTFCNNRAFNPSYCSPDKPIAQQLDEGILFHSHRYRKAGSYLAYFQPYSNTFAPLATLKERYREALSHPAVEGLVIGTRPDCVDEEKLDYLHELSKHCYVAVEYGVESCYNETLQRIRRGHTFETTRKAIEMTSERGLHCGAHLVLGLPGESRNMILDESAIVSTLPIESLKLHQLQIIKGTALAEEPPTGSPLEKGSVWELDEYIGLVCDFLERLRPDIMMERFAGEVPPRFQAFPERSWRRADGRLIRNEEIPVMVEKELERRESRQGRLWKK